jgi:hypothetical protein
MSATALPLIHTSCLFPPTPSDPPPPDSLSLESRPHRRRAPPSCLPADRRPHVSPPVVVPPHAGLPREAGSRTGAVARRGAAEAGRRREVGWGPIDAALQPDARRPSYLLHRPVDPDAMKPGSTAASKVFCERLVGDVCGCARAAAVGVTSGCGLPSEAPTGEGPRGEDETLIRWGSDESSVGGVLFALQLSLYESSGRVPSGGCATFGPAKARWRSPPAGSAAAGRSATDPHPLPPRRPSPTPSVAVGRSVVGPHPRKKPPCTRGRAGHWRLAG